MPNVDRDRLIVDHIGYTKRLVHHAMAGVPQRFHDDAHAAALLGLVEAANRYDKNKDVPFGAYARLRINGAIVDQARHSMYGPRRRAAEQPLSLSAVNDEGYSFDTPVPGFEDELVDDLEPGPVIDLDALLDCLTTRQHDVMVALLNGATQVELARKYGVSQAAISHRRRLALDRLRAAA